MTSTEVPKFEQVQHSAMDLCKTSEVHITDGCSWICMWHRAVAFYLISTILQQADYQYQHPIQPECRTARQNTPVPE